MSLFRSSSQEPRRVMRRLRLRKITHGDMRGFWVLFHPGKRYDDVQFGGRPIIAIKIWRRNA